MQSAGVKVVQQFVQRPGGAAEAGDVGARTVDALDRLSGRGGVAVEVVIDGLESVAEFARERVETEAIRGSEVGEDIAAFDRQREKRHCFEFVDGGAVRGVAEAEVHRLTADEGRTVERLEQAVLEGDEFGGVRRVAGVLDDRPRGEGDQGEGGEHGGGFSEGDVRGGFAPAELGVVHAGKVIDNERGAVEQFNCAGGARYVWFWGVENPAYPEGEQRANALTTFENCMAHGAEDGSRLIGTLGAEQFGEIVLNELLIGLEGGGSRRECQRHGTSDSR
jgi:hypothetical protein